jgi:hypothetical protein
MWLRWTDARAKCVKKMGLDYPMAGQDTWGNVCEIVCNGRIVDMVD